MGKAKAKACYPVGVILTISAAGSETSNSSVITYAKEGLKRSYNDNLARPKFAIMNPEYTKSLPDYQTESGCTDIMMHTMERYFSNDDDMEVTDAIAESILRTVINVTPLVLKDPTNYEYRAQLMWAGSLAHNDLTGCGTTGDWATHNLEHELSGMFDVSHGAGLAAVWGSWARYTCHQNMSRFARFAVNVMGVKQNFKSLEETAEAGILAMEQFFHSIGMPTSIKELIDKDITDAQIEEMADKCCEYGRRTIGGLVQLNRADMVAIYKMARG